MQKQNPMSNVVAVVTTYAPDYNIIDRLIETCNQVKYVILVDDSGNYYSSSFKKELEMLGVFVIYNKENLGISVALNNGIKYAFESEFEFDYILTLDDDTFLSPKYVSILLKKLSDLKNNNIGAISGMYSNNHIKIEQNKLNFSDHVRIKRNLITSGCLYPKKIFSIVGFFDENFFIDLVDFDFCTRIRLSNYKLIEDSTAIMNHAIGESSIKHFFFMKFIVFNHKPFRIFYQVRNVFLYNYKYFYKDPLFSLYLFFGLFKILFKIIFFEKSKTNRLMYFIKGIYCGLLSKSGRL